MRVCLLLPELRPSGGVALALAYARRLAARGTEVEVLLTQAEPPPAGGDLAARRIAEAHGSYDVAIATWWQTAHSLWEVEARQRIIVGVNGEAARPEQELIEGARIDLLTPMAGGSTAGEIERR